MKQGSISRSANLSDTGAVLPLFPGAIARNLRDGLITERQKLTYVVLFTLLSGLSRILNGFNTATHRDSVMALLWMVIALIGTSAAFRTNTRGDNRHFIERWLCLQLSLSIVVFYGPQFLLYGVYVLLFWIYGSSIITLFRSLTVVILLFNMLLICLQFWLLNYFIRIAASGSSSTSEAPTFAPIAAP